MEDILKKLNEVYREQTFNCSEISRKIVFTLLAMVGALAYNNGELLFSLTSITSASLICVSFLLVLYLFVDVLQYYTTANSSRKHFYEIKNIMENGVKIGIHVQQKDAELREQISARSFKFMRFKVTLLPIILLGVVVVLFTRVLNI